MAQQARRYLSNNFNRLFFLSILVIALSVSFIDLEIRPKEKITSSSIKVTEMKDSSPSRLRIQRIGVDVNIQKLGVGTNGEMEVPNNSTDAGWFSLGSVPGNNGSAVIAGHFDTEDGEKGVFANLDKLEKDDEIEVQDATGNVIKFVVRNSKIYNPGYAEEIFSVNTGRYLNLITCDGIWNKKIKSYNKRLIVFTELKK